jgi:hypothetical protein
MTLPAHIFAHKNGMTLPVHIFAHKNGMDLPVHIFSELTRAQQRHVQIHHYIPK